MKDSDQLISEAKQFAFDLAFKLNQKNKNDWNSFRNGMKNGMKNFLLSKTGRVPIILPIILEVDC